MPAEAQIEVLPEPLAEPLSELLAEAQIEVQIEVLPLLPLAARQLMVPQDRQWSRQAQA